MAYKAPIWEDGKSPAISAENLNNLSQAAEGAQVLYGNSAPTSSTKGAVGQFYLVVVADSDGNYPLYQCVAIANGSYTWRDTRRIPDSITSMLGIPAPGTINRALNVLANVGNLHVWEKEKGELYKVEVTSSEAYAKFVLNTTFYKTAWTKNGSVVLTDAVLVTEISYEFAANMIGCYMVSSESIYCVITSVDTVSTDGITVKLAVIEPGETTLIHGVDLEYVTSSEKSAYPDGSLQDGYYYNYLGQLGGGVRIEVGSYVGTGTYGSSNPNSLTFGFNPKLVIIAPPSFRNCFTWVHGTDKVGTSLDGDGPGYGCYTSLSGKTLSYYADKSQSSQMNSNGLIYNYIAIG